LAQVDYTRYTGPGHVDAWIEAAFLAVGVPPTSAWRLGYKTLCKRESSFKPNAVNLTDGNSHGRMMADGHAGGCSRGIAQCVPSTFAAHHAVGTPPSIYHPVSNIAASILYVLSRYKIAWDGSDLSQKVQQADPRRRPRWY
jgi:SLT domain-containing protein